jgi:hypothetical protein
MQCGKPFLNSEKQKCCPPTVTFATNKKKLSRLEVDEEER